MKVRATQQGFYKGRHIDPGTVFDIKDEDFSDAHHTDPKVSRFGWMEKVEPEKKGLFK